MYSEEELKMIEEIKRLKQSKNAIILAHNYQILEIHEIADFVGDSLQLAQEAAKVKADIIVFAGVKFMAETAKLLNPGVKVLLTAGDAGCPMADMIEPFQLQEFKSLHPEYQIVCYVNSSVEIKAESDVCVTSSNAVKIVNQLDKDRPILFVPDQNLGKYTMSKTGREIRVWEGMCPIHHFIFSEEDIKRVRRDYPDHTLIVHPECTPEIINLADMAGSTKGMADYVETHDKIILGTEIGLIESLQAKYPEKSIVGLSNLAICKNMKKTNLTELYKTLSEERNEINIDEKVAQQAVKAINRMLELSK